MLTTFEVTLQLQNEILVQFHDKRVFPTNPSNVDLAFVAADDDGVVGHLIPAVNVSVSGCVVSNLEICEHAKDRDEDDDESRVAKPQQVVAAFSVARGLLHSSFDVLRFALNEACLRLKKSLWHLHEGMQSW